MKRFSLLIAAVALVSLTSCEGKTNLIQKLAGLITKSDTTAIAAENVAVEGVNNEETPTDDQWTEEAVTNRVREIYDRVNEVISKPEIDYHTIDDNFCSKDYKELFAKAVEAEKGRKFDDLCFIEYQPFDQGLQAPIKVSNIRPTLLTGDMAEVFFDLSDDDGATSYPLGFVLYLEDGAWMVHDIITDTENKTGIWDYMQQYVETHKR